ncbi:MAG: four helix bundle protein [Candidatus Levybacteria bacterium CG10_big_fil_rev_8_21_14_0_10_35_13]|nr:MAG: four helix bundle protein [Candidatus Levybacteria bacterium CG10_big_fil_rev_8_21_14_0_10_35_13]
MKSYKELIVWQRAIELVKEVFILTALFPKSEVYGITSQMRRAVVSIPSNIAEGYGRRSLAESSQFHSIAYGSALELETQLIIAKQLRLAKEVYFEKSEGLLLEVCKMLNVMTGKLRQFKTSI